MKHLQRFPALVGVCVIILIAGCAAPVNQPIPFPATAQVSATQAPAAQSTPAQVLAEKTAGPRPTRGTFGAAPGGLTDDEKNTLIADHNQWRARFGSAPVTWDDNVAAVAQDWADQMAASGNFAHRQNNKFGENIWAGSAGFFPISSVTNSWGSEVDNYNLATQTCAPGKVCGHFTQVVWSGTQRLGCGKATGNDGNDYVVCNYDPPGNFTGESPFVPGFNPNAPTAVPTNAPTIAPTAAPTEVPTVAPTAVPTVEPTVAPTDIPTVAPTDVPAAAPTDAPTVAPTDVPAAAPTDVPTVAPTDVPAAAPTDAPTVAPTDAPAAAPTDVPTVAPTDAPTAAPAAASGTLSAADVQTILNQHNAFRAKYGVAQLVWDDTVAAVAQDWANQIAAKTSLSFNQDGSYGENLWAGTAGAFPVGRVVDGWGSQESNYNAADNSCAAGKYCGNFTQMVWSGTTRLGCGKATGPDGNDYIVCDYDPPGNYTGESPFGN